MPSSKQINVASLPAYMRRRVNYPAPVLGLPMVYTFGPLTTSTTPYRVSLGILPRGFRVQAIGWYVRAQTGTANTLGLQVDTANDGTAGQALAATAIDLDAVPSGIRFFDDAAASTDSIAIDRDGETDPEMPGGSTATNPHVKLNFTLTAGSVTDFSCYVIGWLTQHINADKAND